MRALITGGGSGLGLASARVLAADGAGVALVGRTRATLDEAASELRDAGATVHVEVADVADPEAVEAAFDGAAAALGGPIDVLVTAAGLNRPGPLVDAADDDLRAMLDVNVLGTLACCRAFGRRLLAAGAPGSVICLSSQMGAVGYPGRAPYCATKHAVNGLTKALAVEWAPYDIRVNAVAPTFVLTPLTAPMLDDEAFRAEVLGRIPLGRLGTPEDVAEAVRYLASGRAGLVTGHVLAVDGGWTAW